MGWTTGIIVVVMFLVLGSAGAQQDQYEQDYQQQYQQAYPQQQRPQSTPAQRTQPNAAQQRRRAQQQQGQNQQMASPYAQPANQPPSPYQEPNQNRRSRGQANKGPVLSLALTHLLPSAYVIPANTFFFGTSAGYGFGNMFDISTNLFLDLEGDYNGMMRFKLVKGRNFAVAPWVAYFNTQDNISGLVNGTTGITTISESEVTPGITISYRISRRVTGSLGGDYAFQSPVIPQASLPERTSYIQGNQVFKEFTFGLSQFVALSLGGSYDLTYQIWGAGFTLHLSGIDVGAHYYLNVAQGTLLPIIGGGYAINL